MKILMTIMMSLIAIVAIADEYDIPFTPVAEGWSLLRDKDDRTYSAVIYDQEGLNEFLQKYPISVDIKSGLFKTQLLIVGFSDSTWAVRCDGLKHQSITNSPKLYLDLHDKGVVVKAAPPPENKKYTAWCVIAAPADLVISHVRIREGVSGLCHQFGKRKREPSARPYGSPAAGAVRSPVTFAEREMRR